MKTIDLRSDVITWAKGREDFRTCRSIMAQTNMVFVDIAPGMPRPCLGFSKNATSSFPAVSGCGCGWSLTSTSSAQTLTP